MKNLVRVQKITNGRGSIKYITKDSKGEILASYSTQSMNEWEILFDYNQQKFNEEKAKGNWMMEQKSSDGKEAKAVEAKMFVVALPNERAKQNPNELVKELADDWVSEHQTDCYIALHWNKTHTNLHAHILASERKKKESSEIKRAKRNRYYNADGKECKKADAVRIVHKGDVIGGQNELYESGKIDLKSEEALNKIKEHYSKMLGTEMFKDDGLHIPQQHLPRINERSSEKVLEEYERKREYNATVKEFNEIVDTLKEHNHEEILNNEIKPIVCEVKRQKRYRKRYLEESVLHLRETFKYALASFKSLLSVFGIRKQELDDIHAKFNAIESSIKSNRMQIDQQENVLKTQVKWSDFKQKKYINSLIKQYKHQITSLEAQKSDLSESKQKLEVKVEKLQKELEHRLNGITRRIEHYKYECGEYPNTIEDITKLEHQEQMIKQEQDKMSKQAKTQQPTVNYKQIHKQHKSNAAKLHEYEK
jgi:hypothetical protein